jgi:hypothetical protein
MRYEEENHFSPKRRQQSDKDCVSLCSDKNVVSSYNYVRIQISNCIPNKYCDIPNL